MAFSHLSASRTTAATRKALIKAAPLPAHTASNQAIEHPAAALVTGKPYGRLIPVPDWLQYHAWPPIGGLRHLIFHASTNGFDQVIRRVGRRVLIDEAAFFEWVESNGGRDASA